MKIKYFLATVVLTIVILCSAGCSLGLVGAQTVPTQNQLIQQLTQQLVQLLTQVITQLQQQISSILAQQSASIPTSTPTASPSTACNGGVTEKRLTSTQEGSSSAMQAIKATLIANLENQISNLCPPECPVQIRSEHWGENDDPAWGSHTLDFMVSDPEHTNAGRGLDNVCRIILDEYLDLDDPPMHLPAEPVIGYTRTACETRAQEIATEHGEKADRMNSEAQCRAGEDRVEARNYGPNWWCNYVAELTGSDGTRGAYMASSDRGLKIICCPGDTRVSVSVVQQVRYICPSPTPTPSPSPTPTPTPTLTPTFAPAPASSPTPWPTPSPTPTFSPTPTPTPTPSPRPTPSPTPAPTPSPTPSPSPSPSPTPTLSPTPTPTPSPTPSPSPTAGLNVSQNNLLVSILNALEAIVRGIQSLIGW